MPRKQVFSVALDPDTIQQLKQRAGDLQMNPSAYLRSLIAGDIAKSELASVLENETLLEKVVTREETRKKEPEKKPVEPPQVDVKKGVSKASQFW